MNDNKRIGPHPIVDTLITIIGIVLLVLWIMSWFTCLGGSCG